jgi:hypothetical protein
MGSKTVVFCDMCKQEAEEDKLYSLVFKKPGKKTGNRYELCSGCAGKLQVQLVGESELSSGWGFGSEQPKGNATDQSSPEESVADRRARLSRSEPEVDDDEAFVLSKQKETANVKVEESKPAPTKGTDGKCLHYNKTAPQLKTVRGEKVFVQKCKGCNAVLPVRSAEERHSVATGND